MVENIYRAYVREYGEKGDERITVEYYCPGDHILVGYDDGSGYCKDDRHPYKYANGVVVSAMDEVLIVKDGNAEVSIQFDWIETVQDGTLPLAHSKRVK